MIQRESEAPRRGMVAATIMFVMMGAVVGCGSAYTGQIAVPNTNQRLVVGHDSFPSKQLWVIDGGKVESVKIIKEERK